MGVRSVSDGGHLGIKYPLGVRCTRLVVAFRRFVAKFPDPHGR
jgi:hypothetical protein